MSNAILTAGEQLIGLAEALRPFNVHPATGARWCATGVRAPSGERLFLEHVRVGARIRTSAEAVRRLLDRLSTRQPTPPPPVSRTERSRRAAEANAALEAMGC